MGTVIWGGGDLGEGCEEAGHVRATATRVSVGGRVGGVVLSWEISELVDAFLD